MQHVATALLVIGLKRFGLKVESRDPRSEITNVILHKVCI